MLLLVMSVVSATGVNAVDICKAKVLERITPNGSASYVLEPGEVIDGISQYVLDKKSGLEFFCIHGGVCHPRFLKQENKSVEALRLINCKIGAEVWYDDENEITYRVDVVRSRNSSFVLKFDDLENRLLGLGLCNACADNVAQYYIKRPRSRCAILAGRALEGNPDALAALREMPFYCQWRY